jgi:hypothetical protein
VGAAPVTGYPEDVSTEVIERPSTRPSDPDLEDGKVAHIIRKDDQMRGYVLGEEITALCGERFIPTRDPNTYPVCEGCREALTAAYGGQPRRPFARGACLCRRRRQHG